jgi:transposase-like protein
VDASCIWRWVQAYAPELHKRCRPHLKPSNKELDHRTVKKRVWLAKRSNPFKWRHCPGDIVMSCVRYLNNVVEQDHRNVTRRTWLAAGYGSVPTAWRTLRGIEAMDMIRKGRARRATKGDVIAQVKFIGKPFGITA